MLHKVEKALMLETDVPETPNEVRTYCHVQIELIEKDDLFGQENGSSWTHRCLLSMSPSSMSSTYGTRLKSKGFTNHFNIGALMEKGVRFIGNGQAPVHL